MDLKEEVFGGVTKTVFADNSNERIRETEGGWREHG